MKAEYRDEIRDCFREIREISSFISSNVGDNKNLYLQIYSVMRCCGVVEHVFKRLIFDEIVLNQNQRIVNFFEKEILRNPTNPSYEKICDVLNKIDPLWCERFKNQFIRGDMHIQKLTSLVQNRNHFAHGVLAGIPSINDVKEHFISACFVIKRLDNALV